MSEESRRFGPVTAGTPLGFQALLAAVLLLAVVATAACGSRGGPQNPAVTRRDSAGVRITHNDLDRLHATCMLGDSPAVTIGTAEGDERYELYRVFGASRLSDGRIALVNQGSQQLRFYDQLGRFVGQAGRAGEGPGEFRDAFYLWVLPGDTIWVGDLRPWRFLVFSPEGQWIRTVRPNPMYVNTALTSMLDDGRFILAERTRPSQLGTQFELSRLTVVLHAADGSLIDTVGAYPNGRWGRMERDPSAMTLYPLFESFVRVTTIGSQIVVGHMSEPEYSILEAVGAIRVVRIVRWTTGDRTISSQMIEAERRRLAEPYEDEDPETRRRFVMPLVSQDRPVADRFPAYARLAAGRDGRLWVQEYARPTAPEPHQWMAFDAEGGFQCRATIPAFDEILEFGEDYLLIKDRDALGVERVLQYTLGPPTDGD